VLSVVRLHWPKQDHTGCINVSGGARSGPATPGFPRHGPRAADPSQSFPYASIAATVRPQNLAFRPDVHASKEGITRIFGALRLFVKGPAWPAESEFRGVSANLRMGGQILNCVLGDWHDVCIYIATVEVGRWLGPIAGGCVTHRDGGRSSFRQMSFPPHHRTGADSAAWSSQPTVSRAAVKPRNLTSKVLPPARADEVSRTSPALLFALLAIGEGWESLTQRRKDAEV
jgi:hypothetical protein